MLMEIHSKSRRPDCFDQRRRIRSPRSKRNNARLYDQRPKIRGDGVLDGILNNYSLDFCVFGPIKKNRNNKTFSFNEKLCVDADQRIYTCPDGLELDFKQEWMCDNFVIREQISGKCLQRSGSNYYMGSCNMCTASTFFNLTDRCLKPSISEAIGSLLSDDITKQQRKALRRCKEDNKPLNRLTFLQREANENVRDIIRPLGLKDLARRIEREAPKFERSIYGARMAVQTKPPCIPRRTNRNMRRYR